MSYSPCIDIKTENGDHILSCDFSRGGYLSLESKLFDMMSDLIKQGWASYTEESKGLYPAVVKVHKANDLVKKIMMPIIEEIVADVATGFSLNWVESLYMCDFMIQEHEEQIARLAASLETLKSYPSDEGFIVTAWGTL